VVEAYATADNGTVANAELYVNTVYVLVGTSANAITEPLYAVSIANTQPLIVRLLNLELRVLTGLNTIASTGADNEITFTPFADSEAFIGAGLDADEDSRADVNE
jgi:hypothetical protein